MFIYFPEFIYKRTKYYLENTFNKPLDKEKISRSLETLFNKVLNDSKQTDKINFNNKEKSSKEMFRNNIDNILNQNITLPKLELNHCNKYYDYYSEISPISNYDFAENKITICINKIKSHYLPENKDKENLVIESLILKEFSYFCDFNTKYSKKSIKLNDKAKLTIQACRFEIKYQIENKQFYYDFYEKKIEDEIVKRCSYLDFKYRFFDDLEFESSKNDENINLLVKNYIDTNFFN